jgi:hypothetical protein
VASGYFRDRRRAELTRLMDNWSDVAPPPVGFEPDLVWLKNATAPGANAGAHPFRPLAQPFGLLGETRIYRALALLVETSGEQAFQAVTFTPRNDDTPGQLPGGRLAFLLTSKSFNKIADVLRNAVGKFRGEMDAGRLHRIQYADGGDTSRYSSAWWTEFKTRIAGEPEDGANVPLLGRFEEESNRIRAYLAMQAEVRRALEVLAPLAATLTGARVNVILIDDRVGVFTGRSPGPPPTEAPLLDGLRAIASYIDSAVPADKRSAEQQLLITALSGVFAKDASELAQTIWTDFFIGAGWDTVPQVEDVTRLRGLLGAYGVATSQYVDVWRTGNAVRLP